MKILACFVIIIFLNSCGNSNSDEDLRREIDKIKIGELPKQDYTFTEFSSDTITNGKLISEISHRSIYGHKSISITTKYYLKDSLICETTNGPFDDSNFEGQKIKGESQNWILYYLIRNKSEEYLLFQLKKVKTKLEISKIDSLHSNCNKLKLEILDLK
jgi:hypothetical protein